MFSRFRIAIGLALLLTLAFAIPVFAGGWAVITLDELPTNIVAGESIIVGFTVLQHGKTPMRDLDPTVSVRLSKSDAFVVHAVPEGKPGHYAATLTFPKAGEWEWSVQAFTMDQRMPNLNVAGAVNSSVSKPVQSKPAKPAMPLFWLSLVVGALGVVMAFQRKSRWVVGLVVLSLSVGFISFRTESAVPEVEALGKPSAVVSNASSLSQEEVGRQLFVAKGCITCHVNRKVASATDYFTIDMGAPDLSNFSASAEVLRIRLKDPTMAKSDTTMPNLELSEDEIEALIAFINSK